MTLSRREVLTLAAGALLLPRCGGAVPEPECGASGDDFETVLAAFHQTDPEFDGGLSNHGPMATEVMSFENRGDLICGWVKGYVRNLDPLVAAAPLTAAERAVSLGDLDSRAAWIAAFVADLEKGAPRQVLDAAWPTLLPGYAGGSFHGALRTGHALRSLSGSDSAVRRRELGHGLGYWAARHYPLPGTPGSNRSVGLDLVQALAQLPVLPAGDQLNGGFVHKRIERITQLASFAGAVALVDLDVWPVERAISELCAASARLYIADANRSDLGYLHAMDGASILRTMLPWMDSATQRTALGYAFQSVAALHATHADGPGVPNTGYAPRTVVDELRDLGVRAHDEHTIKFVEALLREHAMDPRPEFLVAAELRLGA